MSEDSIALGDTGVTSAEACDLDNDGLVDIVASLYRDDSVGWHRQISVGKFSSRTTIAVVPGATAVSCADLNMDGFADVVVTGMETDALL